MSADPYTTRAQARYDEQTLRDRCSWMGVESDDPADQPGPLAEAEIVASFALALMLAEDEPETSPFLPLPIVQDNEPPDGGDLIDF